MQLYVDRHCASPYAMSAFVALTEKGLRFEMPTLDLDAGAQHSADYAQRSLSHRVPTLVEGDFSLSESSAIAEYADETWPGGTRLYPGDARSRARVRQVQAWLRSDFLPIREERTTVVVFYKPSDQPLSAAAQASAAKLFAGASQLLGHGGAHLCGAHWSIADVDLALMLHRLLLNGDAVPELLAAYARRQWQRPSVQAWVGLKRPPI